MLFLIYGIGHSQSNKKVLLNINLGISASNFYNTEIFRVDIDGFSHPIDEKFSNNFLWGFAHNFGIEYFISNRLSINCNLGYQKMGIDVHNVTIKESQENNYWSERKYEININNHYLVLPITLKTYLNKKNTIFIEPGFYTALLILSKYKITDHRTYQNGDLEPSWEYYNLYWTDRSGHTSSIDFGMSFGIGCKIPINKIINLSSKINMNLGLVNLDALYNNEVIQDGVFPDSPKKMNDYYGFNSSSKNINFNLLFGIDFKLN